MVEKLNFKKPPFTLDRSRPGTLVEQVASALRTAVETGYYKAGDMLPPTRDLAALLGVSRVVAIRAVRRLADERLVVQRPHSGSVVCPKNRPPWKGSILIVVPPGIGNIAANAVQASLRDTLTDAGYLVFIATVPYTADRSCDFALLNTMLRQHFDLIVLLHDMEKVVRHLEKGVIPFIRVSREQPAPCRALVGAVVRRDDTCLPEFIAHCREAGIRSVLQATALRNGPDAVPALLAAGIHAENWRIAPPELQFDTRTISKLSAHAFAKRLSAEWAPRADGRRPLPDLIFFRDDHLTSGAMLALASAGVRVPDDIRIVTWDNCDDPLASLVPLTRIEQDNAAFGAKVAECVLEYLRTGVFPADATFGPAYVRGETM